MTALVGADALRAPQSLRRVDVRSETAGRSDVEMQTQESAFPSGGFERSRPVHLAGSVRCGACGAHWNGTRTAHCARCHVTTSGLRAFEAHQRITGGILQCLPPDKAGLVAAARPWGVVWSQPASESTPWSNPTEEES